jgi:hypothetical protein
MDIVRSADRVQVPPLAVSKRFGRFKDEDEKAVRAPDVVEDQALKQLRAAWQKVEWKESGGGNYSACLEAIKGLKYTSKDVEKFSVACIQLQDESKFFRAGVFLSALINNCPDRDFVIHTRHLSRIMHHLGYKNTKNITVSGDVGGGLGREMECGTITVEGNAYGGIGDRMEGGSISVKGSATHSVGCGMKNGKITIGGDVENRLGEKMVGGTIEVHGNAGDDVGWNMNGGEIHVYGTLGGLHDDIKGGKIYHNGKLIYPKEGGG